MLLREGFVAHASFGLLVVLVCRELLVQVVYRAGALVLVAVASPVATLRVVGQSLGPTALMPTSHSIPSLRREASKSADRHAYGLPTVADEHSGGPSAVLPLLTLVLGLAVATTWFVALPVLDEPLAAKRSCESSSSNLERRNVSRGLCADRSPRPRRQSTRVDPGAETRPATAGEARERPALRARQAVARRRRPRPREGRRPCRGFRGWHHRVTARHSEHDHLHRNPHHRARRGGNRRGSKATPARLIGCAAGCCASTFGGSAKALASSGSSPPPGPGARRAVGTSGG